MASSMLCTQCGTVAVSRPVTPGSGWITFILLWFFIVPGLIYWIWRHSSTYEVCSHCGSKNLVPTTTPFAQAMIATQPQVAASALTEEQGRKDTRVGAVILVGIIAILVILGKLTSCGSP